MLNPSKILQQNILHIFVSLHERLSLYTLYIKCLLFFLYIKVLSRGLSCFYTNIFSTILIQRVYPTQPPLPWPFYNVWLKSNWGLVRTLWRHQCTLSSVTAAQVSVFLTPSPFDEGQMTIMCWSKKMQSLQWLKTEWIGLKINCIKLEIKMENIPKFILQPVLTFDLTYIKWIK